MTIVSEFYVDQGMNGPGATFSLRSGWRYQWIKFGSLMRNRISSMRMVASGSPGHVYGFNNNDFLGRYAALNAKDGWISWWSSLGSAHNDNIESAIVVARNPDREAVLDLGPLIAPEFAEQFDARAKGTAVRRSGKPRIFSLFWPGHDPGMIFVSIEQDLIVDPPNWAFDYAAQVRYDIVVYRTSSSGLDAYVKWTTTWVEGGLISRAVLDALHPAMVAGASALTSALRAKTASLASVKIAGAYLLPGPRPSAEPGDTHDARDGSSLVLVL